VTGTMGRRRWSGPVDEGDTVTVEEASMANKDKGGSKSSKTPASKSLKEKRQAKKDKAEAARPGTSVTK